MMDTSEGWGAHRQGRHPGSWSQEVVHEAAVDLSVDVETFHDAPRARAFHALLGLTFLIAFASLGVQVHTLIGTFGLLPIDDTLVNLIHREIPWWRFPTYLWIAADDGMITYGIIAGLILSVLATAGVAPRLMLLGLIPLYLSFTVACRTFLSFQWDSLLIECGVLALLLRRDKASKWVNLLFLILLFKLYFESGVAKWQSHLGDWQDGSAMMFYYETAPLPTWLAYYAHHLPEAWHHLESRLTLVLELVIPLFIFAPRRLRLVAFVALSLFQIANIATANYGFFSYLSLALHVFLLEDRDLHRLGQWMRGRLRLKPRVTHPPEGQLDALQGMVAFFVAVPWLFFSGLGAAQQFTDLDLKLGPDVEQAAELAAVYRVANTYHLFAHITRERIEPELQSFDGREWTAHPMRYKPGPVDRPPPFVAPHQPRVDFRLWFYGLSYERRTPPFMATLVNRACQMPGVLDDLFVEPLPENAAAVRVVFWRYRFTSPEEKAATGAWWQREVVGKGRAFSCGR